MDEILNLIESVPEGFPFYFYQYSGMQGQPKPAAQCGSRLDAVEKIPRYGVAGNG